ncbi:RNA polymerase II transcription factor SIII (Elongin) subunit A [Ceratobasidium sp. AG-Ba]|nr:RNA polymerase II transcription factor SIII (Elongin) subunit A [Ceratobasidium sp. AG-Ba]
MTKNTAVIWKKRCLDEFIDVRQSYESGSMEEPRSWRKRYFVRTPCTPPRLEPTLSDLYRPWKKKKTAQDERERKISDSASRLRGMYQQGESSKRGRQTIYTTKAPPPKRGRFGSFGISKPRTLIDKARQDTKKIQNVWTGPSSVGASSQADVPRRKLVPLGSDDLFRPRAAPASTALTTTRKVQNGTEPSR